MGKVYFATMPDGSVEVTRITVADSIRPGINVSLRSVIDGVKSVPEAERPAPFTDWTDAQLDQLIVDEEAKALHKALFTIDPDPALIDPATGGKAPFDPAVHTVHSMPYRVGDDNDLPTDRYFRPAWEDQGVAVQVNMSKARAVHMGRIREERDLRLKALDADFIKAIEIGDAAEQQRVATLKQALRDIPQDFDLSMATTPEQLKALWPPQLPARN